MTHDHHPLRPTAIELASGAPFGEYSDAPPLPLVERGVSSLEALEDSVLLALLRPPCVVSFSGGRDSSAMLALAVNVARREGLDEPVAATLRFPDVTTADESPWQEAVVAHLRIERWERLDITDELDLLGPHATALLTRHGVLAPANTYVHRPLMELARDGSIVTGVDGDGLLDGWGWRDEVAVFRGRARPNKDQLPSLAFALIPAPVRTAVLLRRAGYTAPWLTSGAQAQLRRLWAGDRGGEPVNWRKRVPWYARRRYHNAARWSLARLAEDFSVTPVHPLADGRFLAAAARDGGHFGYGSRTAFMRRVFGDLLPAAILERPDKTAFMSPFWGERSKLFAETWDGTGIDADVVDADALRRRWERTEPDYRTALLLQSIWLNTSQAVEQQAGGVVE